MRKRLIAALLIMLLCMGMSMTAYAVPQITPEEQPPAEATEEEAQAFKAAQLKKYYDMPVATNEIKGWPQGPGTYGEAAIIMEAGTGAILYGKNIDDQHYPASITKVLTALVALENGKMDDKVTFTHDCVSFLQPGDSSIGMKENDEITLEQALYATLLASANEAAYAVAENVGTNAGHDYQWFIDQMNARCKELGGTNSNFVNANGLHDENHYTSARDMALIGKELFKHPEFFKIVQTLQYEIPSSGTCQQHVFQQKHKMLQPSSSKYYEYAVGGKTGTAEKLPRGNGKYLVSFIGYAPQENPQVMVYVVIDEPNSAAQANSGYATQLASQIMTDIFPYLGIEKKADSEAGTTTGTDTTTEADATTGTDTTTTQTTQQ